RLSLQLLRSPLCERSRLHVTHTTTVYWSGRPLPVASAITTEPTADSLVLRRASARAYGRPGDRPADRDSGRTRARAAAGAARLEGADDGLLRGAGTDHCGRGRGRDLGRAGQEGAAPDRRRVRRHH